MGSNIERIGSAKRQSAGPDRCAPAFRYDPPAGQDPVPERYEVFTKDRTGLTPKKLTIDDLFKSPFAKRDPKKEPIAMTRPRVSFTSAYKTFLSANGAI